VGTRHLPAAAPHRAGYALKPTCQQINPHQTPPRASGHRHRPEHRIPTLFWSLSFAVSAAPEEHRWDFCELYRDTAARDNDFAQSAAALEGVSQETMRWVGARMHSTNTTRISDPPVEQHDGHPA